MKARLIILLFLALTTLQSCESSIELGEDDLGVVLVMNAQMKTSDVDHSIWLSKSSQSRITPVEDARVSCFINDVLACETDVMIGIDDVPISIDGTGYGAGRYCLHASFSPGDHVVIKAQSGDLHCEATVDVPMAPVILEAKAVPCETASDCELGKYRFTITIQDLKGKMDYYYLRILEDSYVLVEEAHKRADFQPGDTLNRSLKNTQIITTGEPLLNSGARTLGSQDTAGGSFFDNKANLFTDALFRDDEYTMNVFSQENFNLKPSSMERGDAFVAYNNAVVRVFHIEKSEYLYLAGYQFNQSAESGTFLTEDFIFPSNVSGGLGFVSINTAADYIVSFPTRRFDSDSYL